MEILSKSEPQSIKIRSLWVICKMNFLQVKNIESGYGEMKIVKGVSLAIEQKDIVALIGPNGAGKSTVLKTIFGMLKADKGSVSFEGKKITGMKTDELVKLGIGFVPQGRRVFAELSVEENLEMGGFLLKDKAEIKKRLDNVYRMFPILKEKRKQRAMLLSGGQQQMLSIGRALMMTPKLLMLDEPSLGLAPKVMKEIFDMIVNINKEGTAVLLVEQNAYHALKICTKAYVLENGKVALKGGKDITKNPKIKKLYLGH